MPERTPLSRVFLSLLVISLVALALPVTAPLQASGQTSEELQQTEVVEKRTATSRTYANPDGSLTTELFGSPIHYRADNNWKRINSDLVPADRPGYAWESRANSFKTLFKSRADQGYLKLDLGRDEVSLSLEGAAPVPAHMPSQVPPPHTTSASPTPESASEPSNDPQAEPAAPEPSPAKSDDPTAPNPTPSGSASPSPSPESDSTSAPSPSVPPSGPGVPPTSRNTHGNRISFDGVFRGTDVRYDVLGSGVKETLILNQATAPTRYRFRLDLGQSPPTALFKLPGERWGLTTQGGARLVLEPAVLEGEDVSAERDPISTDVSMDGNDILIQVEVDPEWLRAPNRSFPVAIDPSITIQPTVEDADFATTCPTCTMTAGGVLRVGGGSQIWRSLMRFDVTDIPNDAVISQASFKPYYSSCWPPSCPSNGWLVDVHKVTQNWTMASQSQQIQFDPTAISSWAFSSSYTPAYEMNFPVTQLVQDWARGAVSNFGLLIKGRTEALSSGAIVMPGYRFQGDPALMPKLEVTYTSDGVWLDPPTVLHSNGAELSWSRFTSSSGGSFVKYEVHRSKVRSFVPSADTLLTTIRDVDVTSYRDTTAAPGKEFSYKVVANSSASNRETVTLPNDGKSSVTLELGANTGKQTFLETDNPTCNNFGAHNFMQVSDLVDRGLLSFDVSGIPKSATIDTATLSMYRDVRPTEALTLNIHRVTTDWNEGTGQYPNYCKSDGANWGGTGKGGSWAQAGGDFAAVPSASKTYVVNDPWGTESFDITNLVQTWTRGDAPNYGMLFKLSNESPTGTKYLEWGSDDGASSGLPLPTVAITYTDNIQAQGPSVAISSHTSGATVSGTSVKLSASATDDRRVDQLEFLIDDVVKSTDASAPFEYIWNSTTAPNGSHTLKARATDDAGNVSTSAAVAVTVANSAPPTVSITAPAANATVKATVPFTSSITDDVAIDRAEFYYDDIRIGDPVVAPPGLTSWTPSISWNTLDPSNTALDGPHTLTVKAYDNHGQVTTSAARSITVGNTSGTKYIAALTTTANAVPQAMVYDPSLGTQDKQPITVTVKNNSATTWLASDVVLRYRWLTPTGANVFTSADIPLGGDLRKGSSRPIAVDVYPPALADGVDRAQYTLRFDLFEKSTSSYFAAKGNPPLDNPVVINKKIQATALGLETFYGYDRDHVGPGLTNFVNVASGNSLIAWTPFTAPGRGLSTVVRLTYNSLEDRSESPVGNNFSLSLSTLTRLGLPLDIHPNNADTIAGRSNKWIQFTDADGTTHRFNQNAAGGWDEPPGVHLFLREYSTAAPPNPKKWAITRPDGVTFFYDDEGFPTSVEDRNGNKITFTLEGPIDRSDDPGGVKKRIKTVTDAGGRSFSITYYAKADAKKPQVRGKISKITDHDGSALLFDYYDDGNLRRITQMGGNTGEGAFLPNRTVTFTYTTSSGSCATPDPTRGGCPAITGGFDARKAADPKTANQSSRIYSVIDPRGSETVFSYLTSGQDKWKLGWRSDRTSQKTTFSYDIAGRLTTVDPPTPTGEATRLRKFHYDIEGKVDQITDPLNKTTLVSWSPDRRVTKITEPSGVFTEFAYNDNGYMTDKWDQLRNHTVLTYENVAADANDVSTKWRTTLPGCSPSCPRGIPHVSLLRTKTAPEGGQWIFDYDPAKVNVTQVTDPEQNITAYTYNPDGTVATMTDPRGQVTSDPNDFVTRFLVYDANGNPTKIQDAAGGITLLNYDSDGLLRWIQDPNHTARNAPLDDLNVTRLHYDSFHRLGMTTTPKGDGKLIYQTTDYDPNDNIVAQSSPGYGAPGVDSVAAYDEMDRTTSSSNEEGETTTYTRDIAGRVTKVTEPRGSELTSTDKDFASFFTYDGLDRVLHSTSYDVDLTSGAVKATMITHSCYDGTTGDRTSVTSPRANQSIATFSCGALPAFTTTFGYDNAHRLRSVTDPEGHPTSFTYDGDSNVKTITDANNDTETRFYDRMGRLTKVEQPFDATVAPVRMVTTRMFYDRAGNLQKLISPRAWDASPDKQVFTDYVTSYSYDALNRLTRIELPSDASTAKSYVHRHYDPNGNMDWTSLPVAADLSGNVSASQKTQTTYFDTGWIASQDDPSVPVVRFDYDPRGQQTSRIEGNDAAETWDYFEDGMLKARGEKLGPSITYAYDHNNNLATAVDAMGGSSPQRLTATYDSVNRLTTTKQKTDADSAWRVTSYTYDLDSNVATRIDDALEGSSTDVGREQVYTYDKAAWLISQHDKGAQSGCLDDRRIINDYTQIGLEQQRQVFKADGSCNLTVPLETTNWTYYANGNLKTLTTKDRNNAVVESHAVDYIAGGVYGNGNRVKDVFTLKGSDATADCYTSCTEVFTYDARDRLIRDNRTPGPNREFELDRISNVVTETVNGSVQRRYDFTGPDGLPTTKLEAVLNPDGSVASRYFYDSDNVDCITEPGGGQGDCDYIPGTTPAPNLLSAYSYDRLDRLTDVRSFSATGSVVDATTYDYDALDRLVKEVENKGTASQRTTTFTYQGLTNLTTKELRKNASGVTTTQKSFTYDAIGNRISMTDDPDGEAAGGAPSTYTYGYDPHGSVSLLLNDSGTQTVKATYAYKPYGEQDSTISRGDNDLESTFNPYRYSARRWDSGAAQLDMGARRFAPDVGRFIQPDVYAGAVADLGLSTDPITGGNRYSLAGGNPIGFVEEDGHGVIDENGNNVGLPRGTTSAGGGGGGSPGSSYGPIEFGKDAAGVFKGAAQEVASGIAAVGQGAWGCATDFSGCRKNVGTVLSAVKEDPWGVFSEVLFSQVRTVYEQIESGDPGEALGSIGIGIVSAFGKGKWASRLEDAADVSNAAEPVYVFTRVVRALEDPTKVGSLANRFTAVDLLELFDSPDAGRFIDLRNGKNSINHIVEVDNELLRITANPTERTIYSVGLIRERQLTRLIAKRMYVPYAPLP